MKFVVNMNLPPRWVAYLAEAGFQAVHWSDIGQGNAADFELVRWAAEHDYIVLTADLDFGAILASTRRSSPNVVQLRCELPIPESIGSTLLAALRD
jgi:predicted nuclease of predicted toxin-antitoxin system